ncbi:hypothetical protein [Nocardioides acrostichi]|uniref:Bacteriocin biosynthesis cyclodehydratase domain-containing protein n=1 Tax=Nocardioides acrostichi TaxID=2784339 RepID=A0A930UYQ1_9ACTN|nr:hypothetical protein [Nocardioides acrostichi]MBF4160696.1 hypothetical protein [Nocardioides acrostichi]
MSLHASETSQTSENPQRDRLPGHPTLVPGTEVMRRDGDHLQVGFEQSRRLTLIDSDEIRWLLARLEAPEGSPLGLEDLSHVQARALVRLHERGLLADSRLLAATSTAAASRPGAPLTVGSVFAREPASAVPRMLSRFRGEVWVTGAEAACSGAGLASVVHLLDEALVGVVRLVALDAVASAPSKASPPDLVVWAGDREPRREVFDELLRHDVPHLVVRDEVDRAVVGPFCLPGVTACLRCLDAQRTAIDPAHPLVLEQHARGTARRPADPVLRHLAQAWAVRDVIAWLDGETPTTWSATVTLSATGAPVVVSAPLNPECGCSW